MSVTKAQLVGGVGISTADNFRVYGGVIGVAATFTGNVSIGGTLTYEDVTNVDSVGLITARSGIEVGDVLVSGIGVTLSTNGNAVFAGSVTAASFSGDVTLGTGVTISGATADTFTVSTNGAQRIEIQADGDIDIDGGGVFYDATNNRLAVGTTSPATPLDVNGSIRVRGANQVQLFNTDNTSGASIQAETTTGTPALTVNTGGSERARLTASGQWLVGTSSGRGANTFEGTSYASSSVILATNQNSADMPFLQFIKSRGTTTGSVTAVQNGDYTGAIEFIGADGSTATAKTAGIYSQVDGTPGTNDMPGRLVLSTTSDGASSPTTRLTLLSNGDFLFNTTTVGGDNGVTLKDGLAGSRQFLFGRASTTSTSFPLAFYDGATGVGSISYTNTATAYNTTSDYRLKENVTPLTGATDRLKQLPVHRFNFITDPTKTVDGFIAHEAQAVVPECVTGEKDAVDENGDPVYQGIDQSKLVPLLTAALQEAVAKIESLEARLTAAGI